MLGLPMTNNINNHNYIITAHHLKLRIPIVLSCVHFSLNLLDVVM